MKTIKKDGVILAYEDINHPGRDEPLSSLLFVHGWGCDHSVFEMQAKFFSRSHRVVSVDLRGHGLSDAPKQNYTMAAYADDLAWLSRELGLDGPIVVGHSMGGNIALELAANHPEVPTSIIMVDSVVFPTPSFRDGLQPIVEELRDSDGVAVCRYLMGLNCLSTDEESQKAKLLASLPRSPRHVLASTLQNHLLGYDSAPAAGNCRVPIAYVGSTIPIADLPEFRRHTPQLLTAQILGAGHFSQIFVPDQVNAMIARFITMHSSAGKDR